MVEFELLLWPEVLVSVQALLEALLQAQVLALFQAQVLALFQAQVLALVQPQVLALVQPQVLALVQALAQVIGTAPQQVLLAHSWSSLFLIILENKVNNFLRQYFTSLRSSIIIFVVMFMVLRYVRT